MPILPGIFEMVLIGVSADSLSDWHRRFAELFERLYDTGYPLEYLTKPTRLVRFLPVGQVIETHPMALPSERLEIILEQFEVFGVGQCQCRIAAQVAGQGCGKALGNCISMGEAAAKGHPPGLAQAARPEGCLGDKGRSPGRGHGQLDVQRPIGQGAAFLFLLRLLLQSHAAGQ